MSEPQRDAAPKPLGQRLVDAGLINASQLDLALRQQKRSGEFLGEALVHLGFVSEEDITASLALENDVEMVSILSLIHI